MSATGRCFNCGDISHTYRLCPKSEAVKKNFFKTSKIEFFEKNNQAYSVTINRSRERQEMRKSGPSVPVDLLSNFVSTRINDFVEIKAEWEEIEYPKFTRAGVCSNKTAIIEIEKRVRGLLPEVRDLTNAAHCYKFANFGLNFFERDILLSDVKMLKNLRDDCVRSILPALAEAVTVEEYATYIHERYEEQAVFLAGFKEKLSGRPEICALQEMQRMLDQQVPVVLKVREKFLSIEKSERRIPGAAFLSKKMSRDLDEMKEGIWLAMEQNVARRIEEGIATEDGKLDCKVCAGNQITHVFPKCGHAICNVCLPFLHQCHMCRGTIEGAIRIFN